LVAVLALVLLAVHQVPELVSPVVQAAVQQFQRQERRLAALVHLDKETRAGKLDKFRLAAGAAVLVLPVLLDR
jgi:hypothetical protein